MRRLFRVRTLGVVVLERNNANSSHETGLRAAIASSPLLRTSSTHASVVARNDASRLAPTSRDASPKDSPRAYVAATTSSPPRASPEAPARLTNASNAPLRTTYAASPGVPCWRNTSFARTLTRRAPRASTARISAAVSVRNAGDAARMAGKSRSRAPRTLRPLRRRVTVPSGFTFSTTSASSSAAPAAPVLAARNAASPPAASAFSSRRRRTFASTVSPARVHADDPTKKCDAALSAARRAIRNDIVASEPVVVNGDAALFCAERSSNALARESVGEVVQRGRSPLDHRA